MIKLQRRDTPARPVESVYTEYIAEVTKPPLGYYPGYFVTISRTDDQPSPRFIGDISLLNRAEDLPLFCNASSLNATRTPAIRTFDHMR